MNHSCKYEFVRNLNGQKLKGATFYRISETLEIAGKLYNVQDLVESGHIVRVNR